VYGIHAGRKCDNVLLTRAPCLIICGQSREFSAQHPARLRAILRRSTSFGSIHTVESFMLSYNWPLNATFLPTILFVSVRSLKTRLVANPNLGSSSTFIASTIQRSSVVVQFWFSSGCQLRGVPRANRTSQLGDNLIPCAIPNAGARPRRDRQVQKPTRRVGIAGTMACADSILAPNTTSAPWQSWLGPGELPWQKMGAEGIP
jgi:hypothetical protein